MNVRKQLHPLYFLALFGVIIPLAGCAPATTGLAPSTAMQEQLDRIRTQQQQQGELMEQLQAQLNQLQQQLGGEQIITAKIEDHLIPSSETPVVSRQPEPSSPLNAEREVTELAASAATYLQAFSSLATGHWHAAENGFENFLLRFPAHQYAPNARYWLANAQLAQGKTEPAVKTLSRLVNDPDARGKAPAALNQLALIYREQGLTAEADELVNQLRNRYPDSPEARQYDQSNEANN